MSLNKIISEAIEAHESDGVIDRHSAINTAVPQVLADGEMTEMCVRSHLSKAIASSCKRRVKEAAEANPLQIGLFGLRDVHVLDNGEGNIKHTDALSRIEFHGIIRVREQQVNADLAYLKKLRTAEMETRAIWDRHPDWKWGEVEREYARRHPKAA